MSPTLRASALLFATFAWTPGEAAPVPDGLVLVETQSRLEVDAEGRVVSVQTTPALPAEVGAAVDGNLRKMRFAPPLKNGRPVAGVTWARQDACAAPEGGSYRFVVKFRSNGPAPSRQVSPAYPRLPMRAGIEATWKVTFDVAADGSASLVEAKRSDKDGSKRFDREFHAALAGWVKAMRFQPEMLDGQPVATRMTEDVEFILTNKSGKTVMRERVAANDACTDAIAARDGDKRAVALNSPFTPLPSN